MDRTAIIITVLGAVFASTGFWTLVNNIYQSRNKHKTLEQSALLGLLHERIYERCEEYITRGSVTREEYETLESLFQPYADLGGNGTGRRLWEEVNHLPIGGENEISN